MNHQDSTTTGRITAVVTAGCVDHGDVLVRTDDQREVRIRVDASSARSILAELNGLPSDAAVVIDVLGVCLDACAAAPSCVELSVNGGADARGVLLLTDEGRMKGVRGLPAATCLLIAARLGLPVRIRTAPAPAAPLSGPVWEFVESLAIDLQG